jgi:hypothetical protein
MLFFFWGFPLLFSFFCRMGSFLPSKLRCRGRRATWTRAAEPPAGVPAKARPHFEACNARAGARGDRGSKPDRQAPSSPIFSGAQSSQAGRSAAGPRASLLSGCHEQVTGSQGRGGGRGRRRLGRGEGGGGGAGLGGREPRGAAWAWGWAWAWAWARAWAWGWASRWAAGGARRKVFERPESCVRNK